MAESPVTMEKVDCSNGKKKVVVREREYDALSWQGLKTISAVTLAVAALIGTVLFTYYTAEAAQDKEITTQKQRLDDNDRRLNETFQKFNETLTKQQQSLDDTTKAVIRIDTRQEVLIEQVRAINKNP